MDIDDVRRRLPEVDFEDPLEPLGVAAGAVIVLVALGTLAGMPWQYNTSPIVTVLQLLGIVGAIAIGVGLALISQTRRDLADIRD